jgi:ubiquinone/menaquinone biosynthesis C-methylase UbiE
MDKPMSKIMFMIMCFILKCRDIFRPRERILKEIDIKPDSKVLDFGCGPGSYIIHVSKTVGENGKVYALDIHPLAIEKVESIASKLGLANVETIYSDRATGLPDKEINTVLLYDTFHMSNNKREVLYELHRVLRDDGILSFSDHHMREKDIMSEMENIKLFKLHEKKKYTYSFIKN